MSEGTDRSNLQTIIIVAAVVVGMIAVKNVILRATFKAYQKSKSK